LWRSETGSEAAAAKSQTGAAQVSRHRRAQRGKDLTVYSQLSGARFDSNGLRVLLRLGLGEEKKNYTATYRAVQEAIQSQIKQD